MNFDRINEQLHKIKTTKKIEDIHTLVGFLVESFGITECNPEELFMHASVQREISRFMSAQGFRNQAAVYTIPHQSGIPIDIKLFWLKKTTKANLSWVMALTPNYEDNPETNANLNIGIDVAVSENCDSIFIVLSNNLKVRVLELNDSLSLTQQEIFANWIKIGKTTNRESVAFKSELHKLLWKSFDFEPINRKFYLQLVEQFDHLVGHITKSITDQEKAKMFAVRLIGRTLFLWFLRKKEFVNPEFDYFTASSDVDQTQYYREKLEPLFFEVLNTEIKDRSFSDKITPFLNGGLFEPIETDFYKDTKLTFPTGFFTQFFNVLNHYNFTVDEGTSEYEQVAVDPEMLGRVFENLLASLNDETGNQARKSKGAFYTPREIVDYMCEQSLVEYLKTKLPDTANRDRRIEELVTMDEASFREQDHNKRRDWKKDLGQEQVVQALDELKILDPAVGSGAFPMGMLNLLVKVYTRIDTAREKDLAQLKRDILSRSLYGVDIDQMAIQISRLRAWLSILVDMENLKKVEPLPNLDFKFVCANTLIPLDDGSNGLFDGDTNLKEELIKLRDQYYAATRKIDKEKIRKEYLKLINTGSLFASQRELQLKDYNPFNPLNSSGFYDPTLMHGVEAFDVVIGNPPYVNVKNSKQESYKSIYGLYYKTAVGQFDLFGLFTEKGNHLSDKIVCFIVPKPLINNENYESVRKVLLENGLFLVVTGSDIFEAGVESCIFLTNKKYKNDAFNVLKFYKDQGFVKERTASKLISKELPFNMLPLEFDLGGYKVIKTIENGSVTLKDFLQGKEIVRGVECGKKDSSVTKEVTDTPLLKGEDLFGYGYHFSKTYINFDLQDPKKFKNIHIYRQPKLLVRRVSNKIISSYDEEGFVVLNTIYCIPTDQIWICGLLNSKLINFWFRKIYINDDKLFPYIRKNQLETIPIKNTGTTADILNEVNSLVKRIQTKKINNSSLDTSDLESQVDELVMDLYGLNEEEKEIVRNS